jgi:hypothetical protein
VNRRQVIAGLGTGELGEIARPKPQGATMQGGIFLRAWTVLGLISLSGAALAQQSTPSAEHYVAPPVGSTWINARLDTGSFGSTGVQLPMTRGERIWQGAQVITFETPESTLLTSRSGDYLAQIKDEKLLISWDPPYNVDWPLEVGKFSKKSYRMTVHTANRTVLYDLEQRVEAYEDVTTPAGTFKAFRISSNDTLGNENIDWLSVELGIFVKRSLRRTAKHAQGPGSRELEVISLDIKK